MKAFGLLLLVVAVFFDEGTTCAVSSPQCYKNSTRPNEDFLCEWEDQDHSPDAVYTIYMQSSSDIDSSYANQFDAGKTLFIIIPVEGLLLTSLLNIWVHRQVFNVICTSPVISVFLNNSVKYSSPNIQKMIRSAKMLNLSWPRVNDNKGAIHEIRWKKIHESWQNKTFMTEDAKNNGIWDNYTLQLQEHAMYQVQIRRKAKQSLLWSDWSQTSDIPIEIKQPVVNWTEHFDQGGKRNITLTWNEPPPEASFGGISYKLTLKFPCEKKKQKTISNNFLNIVATYSEARVSIVAVNNVGRSASQEIIIPPVEHLKYCNRVPHTDSLQKKKHYCWEWYKLIDGETRPAEVNISRSNITLEDIKEDMEKFVRYYYFLHTGRYNQRRTVISCPVYSTEDAPTSGPRNVTVLNITHNSAVLGWRSIPVQEQHGFLICYVIWISKEGQTDTGHHEVPANTTSFILRNLDAASSYTLSITGRTKIGAGPNSTIMFFTLSSTSTDSGMKRAKIILSVCAAVLIFSIGFSFAIRRLRSKLLPKIPSPLISPAVVVHMDQNLKTMTEEVDSVILLCRNQQASYSKPIHTTSLQDGEITEDQFEQSDDDDDDDQEDDDKTNFTDFMTHEKTSSFQNPNYKGQLLQLPESLEISDKGQTESCEVSTPLYKNGLFFENKGLDNEGISVQL